MAEKLEWTELSGNGGSDRALLLTKQLIDLQRAANEARPWWHKGASWFIAFCVANTMMIWWAVALGLIEGSVFNGFTIMLLVFSAGAAATMQSAQSRRG
jgi:hypothetical protein